MRMKQLALSLASGTLLTLASLEDDVSATHRILDLQDGPSVFVGHSYGGMVVTQAERRGPGLCRCLPAG